jgi:hypothetical protein
MREAAKGKKTQKLSSKIASVVAFLGRNSIALLHPDNCRQISVIHYHISKLKYSCKATTGWNRSTAPRILWRRGSGSDQPAGPRRSASLHQHHPEVEGGDGRKSNPGGDASQCGIQALADRCAHCHERRPGQLPQGQTLSSNRPLPSSFCPTPHSAAPLVGPNHEPKRPSQHTSRR